MAIKDDCIFCKIANHQIESNYVYEDELVCAFEDAEPLAPVHVLVVPKNHHDDITDDVSDEELAALKHAILEVARIKGVDKTGFRIVANTGDDAGQTVRHLHFHVLGGKRLSDSLA